MTACFYFFVPVLTFFEVRAEFVMKNLARCRLLSCYR